MSNVTLQFLAAPVLAQQSSEPGGQGTSGMGLQGLLPIALFFAAMYFLMIAPQRKKQKAHAAMIAAVGTGDEILTSGGIYGVITNVKDDRLVVRIAEGTKIEIVRTAVQAVEKKNTDS